MSAAASAAVAAPLGKPRNLPAMAGLLLITANIYWVYWLYQIYKEMRAHSPGVTTVQPGQAAGFLLIPFFNIYWFFRVLIDFTGTIHGMQRKEGLGDPLLNTGLARGLLIGGIAGNCVVGFIHPALALITEAMVLAGFLTCQSSLNAHWQRHVVGARPGSVTYAPAAEDAGEGLRKLLGLAGARIRWMPIVAFTVALLLSTAFTFFIGPMVMRQAAVPIWFAVMAFIGDLLLAACVLLLLRPIRNEWGGIFAAAGAYSVLRLIERAIVSAIMAGHTDWRPISMLLAFMAASFTLGGLALALRMTRSPLWLAIWVGAAAGQLGDMLVGGVVNFLYIRTKFHGATLSGFFQPKDILFEFLAATVFAFAFWGGLQIEKE
ncbi:MAG TPA: DUF4234 domain-containing protein [Terriglobales bacterium]|nr:DUF4234 domain-containing protein [Terriglobales bacterium]